MQRLTLYKVDVLKKFAFCEFQCERWANVVMLSGKRLKNTQTHTLEMYPKRPKNADYIPKSNMKFLNLSLVMFRSNIIKQKLPTDKNTEF